MTLKNSINKNVIPKLKSSLLQEQFDQRGYATNIEKKFIDIVKQEYTNYKEPESVKSTADITIDNVLIDIKTTDIDRKFKMPNLISIDKLKKLDYNENIMYAFISYSSKQNKIVDSSLFYIWELPWRHLAIQNLGKGQLQIKDMKKFLDDVKNFPKNNKDDWTKEFLKQGKIYYKKMISKMEKYFQDWPSYVN